MIFHWLRTGWRSLIANPLFSLITIASLSVGCCGALLVGANIKQHLSFERWVPAADRIYMLNRTVDQSSLMGGNIRVEGINARRPQPNVPAPMREVIETQAGDVEAAVRVFRGASLLPPDPSIPTTPPAPGDPPRAPPPGSIYVDPEFFDFFGLEFVEGSADGLKEPNQIVISETAAKRVFGDVSPIGQMTEGDNKRPFRVVGVVKDLPLTTHLRFEAISSVRTLQQIVAASNASQNSPIPRSFDSWTNGNSGALYVRAAPGADPKNFADALKRVAQTAADDATKVPQTVTGPGGISMPIPMQKFNYNAVRLMDIHLGGLELSGIQSSGDITMLATLATAAFALLVVSAFNYVTLSLARSLRRRREVAVRKVLGADQGALVRHYLAESAIVTAISLVIGFALAQLLHPWFARTIGQPETLFDLFDPVFLSIALVVFGLLALVVGAYPAFYLAQTRPRSALGEDGAASPGRVGQWVTGGLMGLQIGAATGLLIVSMTMAAQANFIENRPLGFETKDRYQVIAPCPIQAQLPPEELNNLLRRCQTGVRQILARIDSIPKPAYMMGQLLVTDVVLPAFGRSATGEKLGEAARLSVDLDFLQTMGANLVAGRLFDSTSAYDKALSDYQAAMNARARTVASADGQGRMMIMMTTNESGPGPVRPSRVPVVVTRAILPLLGVATPEEAIGQQIYGQPDSQYPFEIIGVVDDWNQRPLKYAVHPIIFVPGAGVGLVSNAIVQIPEDQVDTIREQLISEWKTYVNIPTASVTLRPLTQTLETTYQADFQLMNAVTSFAVVAIIVAGMGVFGLSTFEMRRRVREIGIRKALGASPYAVGALAIGRALMFAAIAALIAWLPGFYVANQWLSGFVYRTGLSWLVLPVATAIVVGFVAFAVSLSAIRAAAIRPGLALRV